LSEIVFLELWRVSINAYRKPWISTLGYPRYRIYPALL